MKYPNMISACRPLRTAGAGFRGFFGYSGAAGRGVGREKRHFLLRVVLIPAALAVSGAMAADTLTLEQAIQRGLAGNPDAAMAAARIAAAEGVLEQARAAFQPQVRVQSGYVRTNQPVSVFGIALNQRSFSTSLDFNDVPAADNWASGAAVTMPLYAGGRHAAGRDAALAAVEASRHSAGAVRQMLAFEITRAFLMIHRTRSLRAAAEAGVGAFESNLKLSRKRLDAGSALKTDALDMEVRLAEAREDLARTVNANMLARQALANLLGMESGSPDASASLPVLEVPPAGQAPLRPEILAAERMAGVAEARIRQARAGNKPSVNAFGSIEHNRGTEFEGEGTNYTLGIMAQWDVWDGKLTRGRIREAEAEFTAAGEAVRRQRLAVSLEVQQARTALREAESRLEASAKSVELAEESVKITRERFGNGLALATQLIDTETALTASRVRRTGAENDRRAAIAALRRALGLPMISLTNK